MFVCVRMHAVIFLCARMFLHVLHLHVGLFDGGLCLKMCVVVEGLGLECQNSLSLPSQMRSSNLSKRTWQRMIRTRGIEWGKCRWCVSVGDQAGVADIVRVWVLCGGDSFQ